MASMVDAEIESDYAYHPGRLLAEELEVRGMTQRALATAIGCSPRVISDIVRGKRPITADVAVDIERVFGSPALVWLRLQARYDLAIARERAASRKPAKARAG